MDRPDLKEDQLDKVKLEEAPQRDGKGGVRARFKTGTTIGKYELIEEIGSGGMSVVYKAQDVALNRFVAIKFLLTDELDGAQFSTRFKQEARALGTLEYANIVKVHESSATTDGVPYIVMDYLSGSTLAELLASEGKLSLGRFLSIMLQACAALEHAHSHGIIHRDIKPSNFILAQENRTELVKLIDFGIAKDMADESGLTKSGEAFGSPLYMSPEQCAGCKLDERSDIYSLGCVMYEAIAGRAPLVGDNSLSTMQKHIKDVPASLTSVLSTSFADHTKIRSVNSIVMKCLEKKPEDRYQTVSEVKEDLSLLLQGEKPPLRIYLSGQKKQIVIGALIGMSLGMGALMIFQFLKNHSVSNIESAATADKAPPQKSSPGGQSATQTKAVSGESNDYGIDPIAQTHEVRPNEKESMFYDLMVQSRKAAKVKNWKLAKELAEEGLPLCVELGNKPSMVGSVYWHIGHAKEHLEDYPAAKRDFQTALDAVSGRPENDCKEYEYHALIGLAQMTVVNQDYGQAIAYYGRAYKSTQTRQPDLEYPVREELQRKRHKAVCMGQIGQVYFLQKDYARCRTFLNASLKIQPNNPFIIDLLKKCRQHEGFKS